SITLSIWRPTYIIEMMNLGYLIAGNIGSLVILISMFYRGMSKQSAWASMITRSVVSIIWVVLQLAGLLTDNIDPMIPTLIISFIVIIIVSRKTKPTPKMLATYDTLNGNIE